jgi:hypothetical protein
MLDKQPIACPTGLALWTAYRQRHPNGFALLPLRNGNWPDQVLVEYSYHIFTCDDCNRSRSYCRSASSPTIRASEPVLGW